MGGALLHIAVGLASALAVHLFKARREFALAVFLGNLAPVFAAALGYFLYDHHVLRKKTVREYEELYGFLFLGILVHLVIDALVQETGVLV